MFTKIWLSFSTYVHLVYILSISVYRIKNTNLNSNLSGFDVFLQFFTFAPKLFEKFLNLYSLQNPGFTPRF